MILKAKTLKGKKEEMAKKMVSITAIHDTKTCPQCKAAAASGKPVEFPLHPNCRCHEKYHPGTEISWGYNK